MLDKIDLFRFEGVMLGDEVSSSRAQFDPQLLRPARDRKSGSPAKDLRRWFGWLVIIGPIHMAEQIWFGLDELQELKGLMAAYYSQFRDPDIATVALVIGIFTIVQSLLYAMLVGGRWKLLAAGLIGALSVGEAHHIVRTLAHDAYFPGFVTSFAYAAIGAMLFIAVVRQWRKPVS